MGYYTHINICFSADIKDSYIAAPFVEGCPDKDAKNMLEAFAGKIGFCGGAKGSLFNWGYVGNYSNPLEFAKSIIPFLQALRSDKNDAEICRFEHILLFYEAEQSEACDCYEIKPASEMEESELVVVEHKRLPFKWNQF